MKSRVMKRKPVDDTKLKFTPMGKKSNAKDNTDTGTENVKVVNTPTVKLDNTPQPLPKPKPTLRLTSDDLPAVKGWKVGSTYKLVVEVKQTSMRQGNEYDWEDGSDSSKNSNLVNATFQVTSVKEA